MCKCTITAMCTITIMCAITTMCAVSFPKEAAIVDPTGCLPHQPGREQPSQVQAVLSTSSQASQPITAGQRSQMGARKRTITDSQVGLPPHLTPEYSQIINEASPTFSDHHPSLIEYMQNHNSNNYHASDENDRQESRESTPTVASILLTLLKKCFDWIVTLLPKSFRDSPIVAFILKSLSDLFSQSSCL